jgi:hypothetical protein
MATSSSVAALVNYDAGDQNNVQLVKPRIAIIPVTYEKVAGNTSGDYIALWRVHKLWSVLSMKFANDALSGLTDVNFGLVRDRDISHVGDADWDVDENVYADAKDMSSSLAWAEQAFAARDLAKLGQQVWQDAGAASMAVADEWYRIAAHLQAASTATGTISGLLTVALPS